MDVIITNALGLLVAAIAVALTARGLNLPYTVGLVVAGIVLALFRVDMGVTLTHDVIFDLILPPLLFEAAINIQWKELRRDSAPILTLAVVGTVVSAVVVAAGMVFFLRWPVPPAMLFGVLIAATDPVAVIAMLKDSGVHGRARLLVESESLFNDGVAAVLFTLVLTWTQTSNGQSIAPADLTRVLLSTVGGGIFVGLAFGGVAIAVAGRTSDHLVECTLTTVCAYGSFLFAEHFQVSGVLAAVAAGLLLGNRGFLAETRGGPVTPRGREFALALWEFVAFLANSVVFLLIGLAVAGIHFHTVGFWARIVTIVLVLAGRALAVYPLCLCFAWSRWRISMPGQHVLWWGGLRGALALALSLALPVDLPYRDQILVTAFGVVAFSVIAQGLTMPLVLRALGFTPRNR